MAPGEEVTGKHGGQIDLTDAVVAARPLEKRYGLPEALNRPMIVALSIVGHTQVLVRQRM
jgi:hypothetical protein